MFCERLGSHGRKIDCSNWMVRLISVRSLRVSHERGSFTESSLAEREAVVHRKYSMTARSSSLELINRFAKAGD